jgi:ABC-type lipoprotein release transport system permease subunit
MFQILLIAFRNLMAHRRRTLLLGGAIAGVTGVLVLLMSLTNGLRTTMIETATTLISGHVNVGGFYKVTSGQSSAVVTEYPKIIEFLKKEVPELNYVTQRGRGWAKIVSEVGSMQVGMGGIDVETEPGFRKIIHVQKGNLDDLQQPSTILIFEDHAKKLGVGVGDVLTVSAATLRGATNTLDVRIVAIAKNMGMMSAWNVYVSSRTLRDLYQMKDDSTGALLLQLKDEKDVPAVQQRLREKLAQAGYKVMDDDPRAFWMKFEVVNREGWTGQKLDITNWQDETSYLQWIVKALGFITGLLAFVLLVIIAVGIMNTLWIAIRERTREVGTLRAIGMQRTRVLVMFMVEALMLSLTATIVGALAASGICLLINSQNIRSPEVVQMMLLTENWFLKVEPPSVAFAVLLITGCSMLVSLIPSFLAARMKPVTAMHHIG